MSDGPHDRTNLIHPQVAEDATAFVDYWNSVCADFPFYQIDLSWPSVGIMDSATFHLRRRASLGESDFELLRGVSSYLAVLIHSVWIRFPDSPKVSIEQGDRGNIRVVATEGLYMRDGSRFELDVTSLVMLMLKSPDAPLPVFGNYSRLVHPDENFLSQALKGVLCGVTRFGDGAWNALLDIPNPLDHLYVDVAARILAKSSAAYYLRNFPEDKLGAAASIYLSGLIVPPLGYAQNPGNFGIAHLQSLLSYIRRRIPDTSQSQLDTLLTVACNFANSPDHQISWCGTCLAIALSAKREEYRFTPFLRYLCQAKSSEIPMMRQAYLAMVKEFQLEDKDSGRRKRQQPRVELGDWTAHLPADPSDKRLMEAICAAIDRERLLGLAPHLVVPSWSILQTDKLRSQTRCKELCEAIATSRIEDALVVIQKVCKHGNPGPELSLQGAYLALIVDKPEEASRFLSFVRDVIRKDVRPRYRNLYCYIHASLHLRAGQLSEANHLFSMMTPNDDSLPFDISSRLLEKCAAYYLGLGETEAASRIVDDALASDPHNLSAKLLQIHILAITGNLEQAIAEIKKLSFICPSSRSVFRISVFGH